MTRRNYSGSALATALTAPLDSTTTTFTIVNASTLPTTNFVLTIDTGLTGEEKVLVGTRTALTCSGVTRGFDGTAAASHNAGAVVQHTISAVDLDEANAHVNATTAHGITGAVVGTTDSQSLSNKTLVNPVGSPFPIPFHFAAPTVGLQTPKFIAPRNCVLKAARHILDSGSGATYQLYVAGTAPTGMTTSAAATSTATAVHDFTDVTVAAGQQVQVYVVNAGTSALGLSVTVDAETA